MHSADYAVATCLSVHLSVRLSDVCLSVCLFVIRRYSDETYPQTMRQLSFLFSQFFRTKHYVALEHPNGV